MKICNLGYCCVIFMQCSSTEFRINNAGIAAFTQAKVGTNCSEDYIGIEGIYFKILLCPMTPKVNFG